MSQVWAAASAYESYIGRWSRVVAREFLDWLNAPERGRWLDVGSGTGALSAMVLESADPNEVVGVDRTEAFVDYARTKVTASSSAMPRSCQSRQAHSMPLYRVWCLISSQTRSAQYTSWRGQPGSAA
jgi:ubiquinone/menaquinone biosynthesis C-methylase UbiE